MTDPLGEFEARYARARLELGSQKCIACGTTYWTFDGHSVRQCADVFNHRDKRRRAT